MVDLTGAHVWAVQDLYIGRVAAATAAKYNVYLRKFLREFHHLGAPDLLDTMRHVSPGRARQQVATAAELALLLDCPDPCLRFVATVAAEAGLRFETICALRPCDFRRGRLNVPTKRGQTVDVPVSAGINRCLLGLRPGDMDSTKRCIDLLNGIPLKSWSVTIHHRWGKWRRTCGIDRKLTFHDLRRGLARRLFDMTGDIRLVQSLLAHASITSTFWYLSAASKHLTSDLLNAAIKHEEKVAS